MPLEPDFPIDITQSFMLMGLTVFQFRDIIYLYFALDVLFFVIRNVRLIFMWELWNNRIRPGSKP